MIERDVFLDTDDNIIDEYSKNSAGGIANNSDSNKHEKKIKITEPTVLLQHTRHKKRYCTRAPAMWHMILIVH